jgi:aspartate racemase
MKKIGIIGGLGPEPTIEYYRFIIESYRKQQKDEGSPEIIIYSLNLKEFLHLMVTKQTSHIIEWLLKPVKALYRAGADFALIAAGTPHIFFDEVQAVSPIPILSIVEETAKVVSELGLKKVALFGTKFTMQADFYQKVFSKKNIAIVIPDQKEQNYIHEKLITELQFGQIVKNTKKKLLSIVKRKISNDSIQGLILGCTELPLILPKDEYGITFFNTTRIHAESAVRYCLL